MCVSKLRVSKLCVRKLCVSKLCVSKRRAAERQGQAEVHNQEQEPHTKMWGIKVSSANQGTKNLNVHFQ